MLNCSILVCDNSQDTLWPHGVFLQVLLSMTQPNLESHHSNHCAQSLRGDLTLITATPVPMPSRCVSSYYQTLSLPVFPGSRSEILAQSTRSQTQQPDLCGVREKNSPLTNPSSFKLQFVIIDPYS